MNFIDKGVNSHFTHRNLKNYCKLILAVSWKIIEFEFIAKFLRHLRLQN
jgi:hypothetical protein